MLYKYEQRIGLEYLLCLKRDYEYDMNDKYGTPLLPILDSFLSKRDIYDIRFTVVAATCITVCGKHNRLILSLEPGPDVSSLFHSSSNHTHIHICIY